MLFSPTGTKLLKVFFSCYYVVKVKTREWSNKYPLIKEKRMILKHQNCEYDVTSHVQEGEYRFTLLSHDNRKHEIHSNKLELQKSCKAALKKKDQKADS